MILTAGRQFLDLDAERTLDVTVTVVPWSSGTWFEIRVNGGLSESAIRFAVYGTDVQIRRKDSARDQQIGAIIQRYMDGETNSPFRPYRPGKAARLERTVPRCLMCSRVLTDPESVALGYGPECRQKAAA